jgi:poly(3-hydroxybutyrate) depolymerase
MPSLHKRYSRLTPFWRRATLTCMKIAAAALALCLLPVTYAPVALAQEAAAQPAPPAPGRGRGPIPVDPRVEIRSHHFADTNEDIPYALYVSSKVSRDKKNPLIVTLHGLGGTHTTMMRPNALDLA